MSSETEITKTPSLHTYLITLYIYVFNHPERIFVFPKTIVTLKVIMLNNETLPPEADMTYESFLDSAMHGTASSEFTSLVSFVIIIPLEGCQRIGATLAVA